MHKVMRIGTVKTWGGRNVSVFVAAKVKDGRLSMTGVVGPTRNGNASGGCGQIDMDFAHRNPENDDKRHNDPITPDQINFAKGWDAEKWFDLLDIWKSWHLNDMHAECEHQRAMGWKYEDHRGMEVVTEIMTTRQGEVEVESHFDEYLGHPCPVCGYHIGSAWLKVELPASVIAQLESMPDADKPCPWGNL